MLSSDLQRENILFTMFIYKKSVCKVTQFFLIDAVLKKKDSSDKLIGNVTPRRCLARHSEQALSALTLYNVEVYFIPFWILFVSTPRAKTERRQSEPKV